MLSGALIGKFAKNKVESGVEKGLGWGNPQHAALNAVAAGIAG